MCFDLDSHPPIAPIAGGALDQQFWARVPGDAPGIGERPGPAAREYGLGAFQRRASKSPNSRPEPAPTAIEVHGLSCT